MGQNKKAVLHRRLNPLLNEWVLVCQHRNQRPWQGQVESSKAAGLNYYEKDCYLCPGNKRANGQLNLKYRNTYVFDNDFAPLYRHNDSLKQSHKEDEIFQSQSDQGICRVICYSPRHDLTMARLSVDTITDIVDLWAQQTKQLANYDFINHVQIFENKGSIMGCSNPHPHGQIWAQECIPNRTMKSLESQKRYFQHHQRSLLADYAARELQIKSRVIFSNEAFVVVVPYWASWPFETLVMPKRNLAYVNQLDKNERKQLAQAVKFLLIKYDNLFQCDFPYSAGIQQAPTDGKKHEYWHFHLQFFPPLLRSATIKKFMVGYEMFAQAQRDMTPELSAKLLIDCANEHYLDK